MNILVVRNNSNHQAIDASLLLVAYLGEQGISAFVVDSASLGNDQGRAAIRSQLPHDLAMAIVLGGDGTVLHTVHLLNDRQVPILPVNFGRLGFLANADDGGLVPLVAEALADELIAEQRSLLTIDVVCEGEADPYGDEGSVPDDFQELTEEAYAASIDPDAAYVGGTMMPPDKFGVNLRGMAGIRRFIALNEIAITRGALGRIIELSLGISGTHVARMRGDGLVVSTATGSTAYALSAGGPLISPRFGGLVAVPLAPHTLRSRAIVTDRSDIIEVTFDDTEDYRDATLFVDGEIVPFDRSLAKVYLQVAPYPVTLLRASGATFYERISHDFFGE